MTKSEYQELVEFLGPKFDRIDRRFDAVDRRFDVVEERLTRVEERLTRVEVLGEDDRGRTRILAEAVSSLTQKIDSLRDEMVHEFWVVRTEMAKGFERLDSRVTRLEGFEA
jgi:hypothetical protein